MAGAPQLSCLRVCARGRGAAACGLRRCWLRGTPERHQLARQLQARPRRPQSGLLRCRCRIGRCAGGSACLGPRRCVGAPVLAWLWASALFQRSPDACSRTFRVHARDVSRAAASLLVALPLQHSTQCADACQALCSTLATADVMHLCCCRFAGWTGSALCCWHVVFVCLQTQSRLLISLDRYCVQEEPRPMKQTARRKRAKARAARGAAQRAVLGAALGAAQIQPGKAADADDAVFTPLVASVLQQQAAAAVKRVCVVS